MIVKNTKQNINQTYSFTNIVKEQCNPDDKLA